METQDGLFYFLSKDYLLKHKDSTLMSTWKNTNQARPFYCISDPERPEIKWMIPLSSHFNKWAYIKQQKKIDKKDTSMIVINRIARHRDLSVFLVQNACPCLKDDVVSVWVDNKNNPLSMDKMFEKRMKKQMKLVAYKINAGVEQGCISMPTFKEVLKEYIQSKTITSKDFAKKCIDALKNNNPEQLENFIVKQGNGKKYSIISAEIDYENDNINVIVDRKGKSFVVNCLDKEKMDCNFEKENQRDIFREELLNSEMEME